MTRVRNTEKERAARAANREIVDREEYQALCALRDGVHENLKLEYIRISTNFSCLEETVGDSAT